MKMRFFASLLLVWLTASIVQARVPEPPLNLTADVTGNTVTLNWQAPAAGAAPLGYVLEAALSPGGAAVALFAVESTSIIVSSVPNGVFYVRVRAADAQGVGAASNEVVVAVPNGGGGCGAAPDAPGGLVHTVVGDQVTLNWNAPVSGCPASGFVIQAGSSPGATDLAVINVAGTSFSVTAPPGTYYVRVIATNASGGSLPSNEVVVAVPQP